MMHSSANLIATIDVRQLDDSSDPSALLHVEASEAF